MFGCGFKVRLCLSLSYFGGLGTVWNVVGIALAFLVLNHFSVHVIIGWLTYSNLLCGFCCNHRADGTHLRIYDVKSFGNAHQFKHCSASRSVHYNPDDSFSVNLYSLAKPSVLKSWKCEWRTAIKKNWQTYFPLYMYTPTLNFLFVHVWSGKYAIEMSCLISKTKKINAAWVCQKSCEPII